jgi:hypothetical protein
LDAPVKDLSYGNCAARGNTLSCSTSQTEELMGIAARPPRGLSLLKYGSRSVVGTYILRDGTRTVLKYYYPKSLLKHIGHGMGGSRCERSWLAALGFQYLGLPTPPALITAEWRRIGGIWLEKSFLATHEAGGIALDTWVTLHQHDIRRLDAMARQLRECFLRMARVRTCHGDLKASNIIVDESDALSFVDLDAVRFLAPPSQWRNLRRRDERIFNDNWLRHPAAERAFAHVFDPG